MESFGATSTSGERSELDIDDIADVDVDDELQSMMSQRSKGIYRIQSCSLWWQEIEGK